MQKSMKEKDQGFTLIELLVVIVIIGILAAIAIPVFLNQRKKGVDASLKSDLKNAATAVETYYDRRQPLRRPPRAVATPTMARPTPGYRQRWLQGQLREHGPLSLTGTTSTALQLLRSNAGATNCGGIADAGLQPTTQTAGVRPDCGYGTCDC